MNEEQTADLIKNFLEKEGFPQFEHQIFERLVSQNASSFEESTALNKVLNNEKLGFGKIGQRYFRIGDNYYSKFIPHFQYIQNSLNSTIGSQSSAFIPFLFFLGRANCLIKLGEPQVSIYNVKFESSVHFEHLSKELIEILKLEYPNISEFLSQMGILLGQLIAAKSVNRLFYEVLDLLKELELGSISDLEFSMIFEHVLQYSLESTKSGFALSDPLMSEILNSFIEEEKGLSIFDPYLGIGSFLTSLARKTRNNGNSFYGVELNKEIFELACLNFIANYLPISNLHYGDSTLISRTMNYDYVISDLPGTAFSLLYKNIRNRGSNPIDYIQNALGFCRNGGKALLFVPDSFLNSNVKIIKDFRKNLIERGAVEGVVRFPIRSKSPHKNNFVNLIILQNQLDGYKEEIKLLDLSNSETPILPSDFKLFFSNKSKKGGFLRLGITILKRNDYDLNPLHYDETIFETEKLIKNGQAAYLGDLATIKQTGAPNGRTDYREQRLVLLPRSISEKLEDAYVSAKQLVDRDLSENKYKRLTLLNQDAILLNRIGRKFCAMIFKPTIELPEILLWGDIYIILPNPDKVQLSYLYHQLYTPIVQDQIKKFSKGSLMITIRRVNLSKIAIPIMSLSAQNEFVATQTLSIKSLEKKIQKEELEEKSIEEQKAATQDEVVRTFVHQIRAKITTINNNTRSIGEILEKYSLKEHRFHSDHEFELLKRATTSQIFNHSIGDYLEIVDRDYRHLQKELAFIREVMNFELKPEKIQRLRIKKFFLKWAEDQKMRGENKIGINVSGNDPEVEFSPEAFISLGEQFYNNTLVHGISENYKTVDISLSIWNMEKIVSIEFRNNGEPMEIDFDGFKELFRKRNKSNGSGIGGNYIYRIVKAHKGEIFPIEDPSGFGFKVEIPKKQKYED